VIHALRDLVRHPCEPRSVPSVLARIAELGSDRMLCLGDVVGYHADPNACVDLVRSGDMACVMGTTMPLPAVSRSQTALIGSAGSGPLDTGGPDSGEQGVPAGPAPHLQFGDMVLCHGSINDTDQYIFKDTEVRENLAGDGNAAEQAAGLLLRPYAYEGRLQPRRGCLIQVLSDKILLTGGTQYLINPRGVGQPRDGDPQTPFLIYDTADRTVVFHRVEYDIAACQRKILRAGLPARLAERLAMEGEETRHFKSSGFNVCIRTIADNRQNI